MNLYLSFLVTIRCFGRIQDNADLRSGPFKEAAHWVPRVEQFLALRERHAGISCLRLCSGKSRVESDSGHSTSWKGEILWKWYCYFFVVLSVFRSTASHICPLIWKDILLVFCLYFDDLVNEYKDIWPTVFLKSYWILSIHTSLCIWVYPLHNCKRLVTKTSVMHIII